MFKKSSKYLFYKYLGQINIEHKVLEQQTRKSGPSVHILLICNFSTWLVIPTTLSL